jgi:redox-sensitive bicupin YhaK (pirin superfamily)
VLLASKDGRAGSIQLQQDVDLWMTRLLPSERRTHELRPGRHAWLHVARGEVQVNGAALGEGDGAALTDERQVEVTGGSAAELLLFDLA